MGGAFKQRDNDDGAFVTERIPMLPLGMYSDGKARVAWPGMLYEPYAAIRDYMTAPGHAMSPEIREKGARAGSYAAELAGTGGLATAGMRPSILARNSTGDMLKLRAGYRPPSKPQRPFDDDYAAPPGDPGSRLETTIDGDPLTARYVAGRRTVGGDDVGLSPEDTESAARALFTVNSVDPSLMPAKGAFGSFSPSRSEIRYRNDLDPEQTDIVVAHELGHGLDGGIVDNTGQVRPLRKVYHDLATGDTRITKPKQMMGPEQYGYPANQVDGEMTAEAIRAYLQDPNYFKSVAPEMARRIREAVNTDPRLRDVIQFNANPSTAAGAFMMTPPAGAFDSTNDDPYGPDFLERGA